MKKNEKWYVYANHPDTEFIDLYWYYVDFQYHNQFLAFLQTLRIVWDKAIELSMLVDSCNERKSYNALYFLADTSSRTKDKNALRAMEL